MPAARTITLTSPWSCEVCTYINEGPTVACSMCFHFRLRDIVDTVAIQAAPVADPRTSEPAHHDRQSNEGESQGEAPGNSSADNGNRNVVGDVVSGAMTGFFGIFGALTGALAGAIAGRASNSGMLRGAGIGAMAGAILTMEAVQAIHAYLRQRRLENQSQTMREEFEEWFRQSISIARASGWQLDIDRMGYEELLELFGPGHAGAPALSPKAIARLPKGKFSRATSSCKGDTSSLAECREIEEEWRCSICLEEMEVGTDMRKLPACSHVFHVACVDKWLQCQAICPVCRSSVSA